MANILVALDESENAEKLIEFIAESFGAQSKVMLMSVVPDTASVCGMDAPSLIPLFRQHQQDFCVMEEKKRKYLEQRMNEFVQKLTEAGFDQQNIRYDVRIQQKDPAEAIIEEADKGFDMIVMGRRGRGKVKEFLMGSVSQKVLHAAGDKTVVVVS